MVVLLDLEMMRKTFIYHCNNDHEKKGIYHDITILLWFTS